MEQNNVLTNLSIDSNGGFQLNEIAKWSKFLAITGFIMCGLLVVFGFFTASIFTSLPSEAMEDSPMNASAMGGVMTVIYILIALIYFFPVLYLYQAATRIKTALITNDQPLLNEGFTKLKAFFRFIGVLMIITLCFYALALLFVGAGSLMK